MKKSTGNISGSEGKQRKKLKVVKKPMAKFGEITFGEALFGEGNCPEGSHSVTNRTGTTF